MRRIVRMFAALASLSGTAGCGLSAGGRGADPDADFLDPDSARSTDSMLPYDTGSVDPDFGIDGASPEDAGPDGSQTLAEVGGDAVDPWDGLPTFDTGPEIAAPDAPVDSLVSGPPPCIEPGSKLLLGHCYWLVESPLQTWPAAEKACESGSKLGHLAHLVTITTDGEESLVASLTGATAYMRWIGLRSTKLSDKRTDFTWITGEPSAVSYWQPGQPNRAGLCVAMYPASSAGVANLWNDIDCTYWAAAYVCERD